MRVPKATDFWIGFVAALMINLLRRIIIKSARPVFMVIMKEKYVGDDREERSLKSSTNLFKLVYYSASVFFGYLMLREVDFLPPCMGGTGSLRNLFTDYPNWKKPDFYDVIFIASSGYHIETLFNHIFSD